jgi:hypothetical protein
MALLFEPAQGLIAGLERLPGLDQLAIDQQPLVETGLPLGVQLGERIGAGGELLGIVLATGIQLTQLRLHAFERLRQRGERGAARLQRQGQGTGLVGDLAGVHARLFADLE